MHVVQGPPVKQPLAEGGYPVEIKVNIIYLPIQSSKNCDPQLTVCTQRQTDLRRIRPPIILYIDDKH